MEGKNRAMEGEIRRQGERKERFIGRREGKDQRKVENENEEVSDEQRGGCERELW